MRRKTSVSSGVLLLLPVVVDFTPFSCWLSFAMSRLFVFADEAGDFQFEHGQNISRYFILCTVAMGSCSIADDLLALRRELAWDDAPLGDYFHASTDAQQVRDAVFKTICRHDFSIQATIMEKSKAQPQVRISRPRFYKYGWLYHFRYGMPGVIKSPEVLITAASLGTKKERRSFTGAVKDVMQQTIRGPKWVTAFFPANTEPCVQVADYCAWAIQRKWERRKDGRSYELISDRITYEFDLWAHGTKHYY